MKSIDKKLINQLSNYFTSQPVLKAYLFGSFARNEQNNKSDIDILVELDPSRPIGLEYCQMYLDLTKLIGREVDLVSVPTLSKYIKPIVEREKILIYEKQNT